MTDTQKPKKPKAVLYAERALWAWTAWISLFGIYQSWASIPDMEKMMTDQLQGAFTMTPGTLLEIIVSSYLVMAATSAWIVFKIGAGKNWARTSLLLGFVLEVLWAALPPYHGALDHLADIPDLGLQGYAIYLLYTGPGRTWFTNRK